jgi:hypothetical protein
MFGVIRAEFRRLELIVDFHLADPVLRHFAPDNLMSEMANSIFLSCFCWIGDAAVEYGSMHKRCLKLRSITRCPSIAGACSCARNKLSKN